MKHTLSYLQAELHLKVSTLCRHLRNKAYPPNSEAIYSAMTALTYYQIMVDELDQLLYNHERLIESLTKFLQGEEFNQFGEEEESIYQFCLHYFKGDGALGSTTAELDQWVATHADRNQLLRQSIYSFFPGIDMQVIEEGEVRPVTEAEKFESETKSFLQDIEASNALMEFNQLMLTIRALLEQEAPVAEILMALNTGMAE